MVDPTVLTTPSCRKIKRQRPISDETNNAEVLLKRDLRREHLVRGSIAWQGWCRRSLRTERRRRRRRLYMGKERRGRVSSRASRAGGKGKEDEPEDGASSVQEVGSELDVNGDLGQLLEDLSSLQRNERKGQRSAASSSNAKGKAG
jgi:hypothetical protein